MTGLTAYMDFYSGHRTPNPADTVEFDAVEVVEEEAAELSHRIYVERAASSEPKGAP